MVKRGILRGKRSLEKVKVRKVWDGQMFEETLEGKR